MRSQYYRGEIHDYRLGFKSARGLAPVLRSRLLRRMDSPRPGGRLFAPETRAPASWSAVVLYRFSLSSAEKLPVGTWLANDIGMIASGQTRMTGSSRFGFVAKAQHAVPLRATSMRTDETQMVLRRTILLRLNPGLRGPDARQKRDAIAARFLGVFLLLLAGLLAWRSHGFHSEKDLSHYPEVQLRYSSCQLERIVHPRGAISRQIAFNTPNGRFTLPEAVWRGHGNGRYL